jgi:CubicO group peptidase (beta-lactamase class C family)
VLWFAVALLGSGAALAADHDGDAPSMAALEAELERELPAVLERDRVPGAQIALLHRGEVVWERAAGVADRGTGAAVGFGTVFQVASLSKPVTALGVLQLAEEGRLDLDRPVWDYVERWRPPPSPHDLAGVTARRLLSHRAGIGLHGYPGFPPDRALPTLLAALDGDTAGAGRVTLEAEPGADVRYSSGGYTLLQLVVEEVTGEPFAAFMQRRVLDPLGMTSSTFEPGPTAAAGGHGWWGRRLPAYHFREQAATGLYSTAGDLARFLRVLSSAPAQRAVGVSPATVESMLDAVEGGRFTLGFAVEPLPTGAGPGRPAPARMVSHTGASRGFRAVLAMAPDRGEGLVVLANSDRAQAMTTDLLCGWGSSTLERELASCWVERKRRGTLLLVAGMVGLGVLMDGLAFALRRPRLRADRHPWASSARLGLSVTLLAAWWMFWYTDELAARREGIAHFMPVSGAPPTFFWLTVVITVWCLLGIARWAVAMRARHAPAAG